MCSTRHSEGNESHEVLSKEFWRLKDMIREYGQAPRMPHCILRLKPKLEFYNRFMNVLKCFTEPVWWFTVQGFTCLQIKRGHTGPNSCLIVFFLLFGVFWVKDTFVEHVLYTGFTFICWVQFVLLNPYTFICFCQDAFKFCQTLCRVLYSGPGGTVLHFNSFLIVERTI